MNAVAMPKWAVISGLLPERLNVAFYFCRNNFWRFFEKVSSASPLVKNFNFEVKSKFGAKVLKFEMEEKN